MNEWDCGKEADIWQKKRGLQPAGSFVRLLVLVIVKRVCFACKTVVREIRTACWSSSCRQPEIDTQETRRETRGDVSRSPAWQTLNGRVRPRTLAGESFHKVRCDVVFFGTGRKIGWQVAHRTD